MDEKIICSTTDHIEVLGLSVRVFNALRRSKIWDVGEVIVLSDDQLFAVRNLGEKGVAEIKRQLERVSLIDAPPIAHEVKPGNMWQGEPQILVDLGPPMIPRHEVVVWQQSLLSRQIRAGLLHPDLLTDGVRLGDLASTKLIHDRGSYARLLKILTQSVSVSDELEMLLHPLNSRELEILRRRFGFKKQTLEEIADSLSLTRERIRQIEQNVKRKLVSSMVANPLHRIRSALLFGDDMDLSFDDWYRRLLKTGLLGEWTQEKFTDCDQLEQLLIMCRLLEDAQEAFVIPESLKYMIRLHGEGMSAASAWMLTLLECYTGDVERLVKRHLRYSGAVSLDWMVNQEGIRFSIDELRSILETKTYFRVGENWLMSLEYSPHEREYFGVLHRSLLKMFQYCGPLSLRDVYFGIERTLIKVDFPIPPLSVVEQILTNHGYANENNLWFWPGDASEELNSGEKAIWKTIHELGGVAHHSELMQAILDSGLSGASLHGTLRRSPLFDKFDQALYKLRGTHPKHSDIERARSAATTTRVDLSLKRDTYGNITVGANLGILAIANGTIVSESMPNLEGDWQCAWGEGESTEIRVTRNEIRGLLGVVRFFECEQGDRILLTFNVLDRTVAVRKIEANLDD